MPKNAGIWEFKLFNLLTCKMNKFIYTVGHSNMESGEFLDLLGLYGVEVLVDVRSVPYSKYASWFNRENIKKELVGAGIKYVCLGDVIFDITHRQSVAAAPGYQLVPAGLGIPDLANSRRRCQQQ